VAQNVFQWKVIKTEDPN
jgi:tubulin polyglutamylase TTLL6/13